ncbi:hypothetical protein IJI69_02765 [Candidatus Saccharibacteria bacterium]|nr:hypothetical protein [Candidatus Saccharibacteria bacterium]
MDIASIWNREKRTTPILTSLKSETPTFMKNDTSVVNRIGWWLLSGSIPRDCLTELRESDVSTPGKKVKKYGKKHRKMLILKIIHHRLLALFIMVILI